jgi:N-acetylmuramic acid 6-phosphate (MurNAc-6-P) etherase
MVNKQLNNQKLIERGVRMIREAIPTLDDQAALEFLKLPGSVKNAIEIYQNE